MATETSPPEPKPNAPAAVSLDEPTKQFMAYQVAEIAKDRILTWAKWIGGCVAVLFAIVGIRAYSDFQGAIKSINAKIDERIEKEKIDEKINAKVDSAIKSKTDEMENFKNRLQTQYVESLVLTKTKAQEVIRDIQSTSEEAKQKVKSGASEALVFIARYKEGGLPEKPNPTVAESSSILFGDLTQDTLGISASSANENEADVLKDGQYYGAFMYPFLEALRGQSRLLKDVKVVSMQQAVQVASSELKAGGMQQTPVIAGGDKLLSLSSASKPASGKIVAVLVGINAYPDFPLKGCINDAQGLRNLLVQTHGVDSRNIQTVIDGDATSDGIQKALQAAKEKLSKDDTLIFQFSGHTTTKLSADKKLRFKAIAPFGPSGTMITIADLAKELSGMPCKQRIIIID